MTALLPAFALLTVIAIGALLWPVFRRQQGMPRQSFEIEVYRDQLTEIERDRERGVIGPDEARAGRIEIERRLLRATSPSCRAGARDGWGPPNAVAGDGAACAHAGGIALCHDRQAVPAGPAPRAA